jgi:hypothetical protein
MERADVATSVGILLRMPRARETRMPDPTRPRRRDASRTPCRPGYSAARPPTARTASRIVSATASGWDTLVACEAPASSRVPRDPARWAPARSTAAGMLRSSAPNTCHEGRPVQPGGRLHGVLEGGLGDGTLRGTHQTGHLLRHVGGELLVEAVGPDDELRAAGRDRMRVERVAERRARRARGEREGALAPIGLTPLRAPAAGWRGRPRRDRLAA